MKLFVYPSSPPFIFQIIFEANFTFFYFWLLPLLLPPLSPCFTSSRGRRLLRSATRTSRELKTTAAALQLPLEDVLPQYASRDTLWARVCVCRCVCRACKTPGRVRAEVERNNGRNRSRSAKGRLVPAGESGEEGGEGWRKRGGTTLPFLLLCRPATLVCTVTEAALVILISSDMNTFEDTQA